MLTVSPSLLENHAGHGDDYACTYIRTLVSGFCREDRERWRYLMLQSALDDSGKDGISPAFVLAGYFASPAEFMDMADAWRALLIKKPKLDYIKGYEAFGLHTQFKDWTVDERDDRLLEFVELVARYSGRGIAFVIDREPFSLIKNLKDDAGVSFKDPYQVAYLWSISTLLQVLPDLEEDVMDMVFDRDLITCRQAARAYRSIFKEWPAEITQRLLQKKPHWEDDRQFLPLQAADLLAYCVRAGRDPDKRHDRVRNSPVYAAMRSIPTVFAYVDRERMQYLQDRMIKRIPRQPIMVTTRW